MSGAGCSDNALDNAQAWAAERAALEAASPAGLRAQVVFFLVW